MQYPAIWHSDLIFYLLTKFLLPRAAINCRSDADFSKLIARMRDPGEDAISNHFAK